MPYHDYKILDISDDEVINYLDSIELTEIEKLLQVLNSPEYYTDVFIGEYFIIIPLKAKILKIPFENLVESYEDIFNGGSTFKLK